MRATIVILAVAVLGGIVAANRADSGAFAASAWSDLEAPAPTTIPSTPDPEPTTSAASGDPSDGCVVDGSSSPTGRLVTGEFGGEKRIVVEIEDGLAIDADCVAEYVVGMLADVGTDITITVASAEMVARLCAPLDTTGLATCWNGSRAMVDADTWLTSSAKEREDLVRDQVTAVLAPLD